MAEDQIQFVVDPGDSFKKAIDEAAKQVDDLTIPLQLIARSWFKSNRALFALKSEGKFADLSPSTKLQKQKDVGFTYPILRRSGVLEDSITDPGATGAISVILNKKTLVMGTSIPYAPFLHFGTRNMPERPFVMVGAEQTGPEQFNERQALWQFEIQTYVANKLSTLGTVKQSA